MSTTYSNQMLSPLLKREGNTSWLKQIWLVFSVIKINKIPGLVLSSTIIIFRNERQIKMSSDGLLWQTGILTMISTSR